jgi:hypothetical protein
MTLPVEQLLAMAPAEAFTAVAGLVFAEAWSADTPDPGCSTPD